jgi:aryl-alcohol dehydrogenase-like predicted oxidoreductase
VIQSLWVVRSRFTFAARARCHRDLERADLPAYLVGRAALVGRRDNGDRHKFSNRTDHGPNDIGTSRYSLMYRDIEKPMEPFCVKYGLGMNSYFQLAGGLLTGKYPPPAYSAWKVGCAGRSADRRAVLSATALGEVESGRTHRTRNAA